MGPSVSLNRPHLLEGLWEWNHRAHISLPPSHARKEPEQPVPSTLCPGDTSPWTLGSHPSVSGPRVAAGLLSSKAQGNSVVQCRSYLNVVQSFSISSPGWELRWDSRAIPLPLNHPPSQSLWSRSNDSATPDTWYWRVYFKTWSVRVNITNLSSKWELCPQGIQVRGLLTFLVR